ncbi:MAG: glycosyltransferase, partial [Leptolyngbya sp. SIO3F4]|nr:glycosyltransferase [Leptolyngbya sp. SIO3F4]
HERFDLGARRYISDESNVFVGWSSLCLESMRRAKDLGAITIVDRGNSHMENFMAILREEYERWGLTYKAYHPGVCAREIQEYEEADFITVPSLFVKRTFLERGIPEEKLIYIPYGVSLEEFSPVPKQDDIFRIIHCGGISLRKGIPYLLQAFHELALPKAELWLVGSLTDEMRPILENYSNDNIILKGWYPQTQLIKLYTQCSVFCLASVEDGFGMVILQAMACGLPVIHTTNTGGADIVRDGIDGFSIPIRDVEALKEKILFFYENPEKCAEMGTSAYEQVKLDFSWDDYGSKVILAYQQALAK